jgi:hypothetical protein
MSDPLVYNIRAIESLKTRELARAASDAASDAAKLAESACFQYDTVRFSVMAKKLDGIAALKGIEAARWYRKAKETK